MPAGAAKKQSRLAPVALRKDRRFLFLHQLLALYENPSLRHIAKAVQATGRLCH